MADLKRGDRVSWATSQGRTTGTVVRKLTAPMDIKGHHVAASKDHPEYLVETEESGEQAAHKRSALRKLQPK